MSKFSKVLRRISKFGRYYVRQSEHIQDDLKRGWSSWNFGQEGVLTSDFEAVVEKVEHGENPLYISGMEIWPDAVRKMYDAGEFGELYPGYWVLKDTRVYGVSAHPYTAENDEQAIQVAESKGYSMIDFGGTHALPDSSVLIKSLPGDVHVFRES